MSYYSKRPGHGCKPPPQSKIPTAVLGERPPGEGRSLIRFPYTDIDGKQTESEYKLSSEKESSARVVRVPRTKSSCFGCLKVSKSVLVPDKLKTRSHYNSVNNASPSNTASGCADDETASDKRPLQHRRGRGSRRNYAFWTTYNARPNENDPFDNRECLFSGPDGKINKPALANLDTGLKVPGGLIMPLRYAKQLGLADSISPNFTDPGMRSVSGHDICVTGVVRNVIFRLKGASVTFLRDFYVCDIIDDMVDIMAGAQFVSDQFNLLFGQVKKLFSTIFTTWFSTKKERKKEKEERERREREQKMKANEREMKRLQREQEALLLLHAAQQSQQNQ